MNDLIYDLKIVVTATEPFFGASYGVTKSMRVEWVRAFKKLTRSFKEKGVFDETIQIARCRDTYHMIFDDGIDFNGVVQIYGIVSELFHIDYFDFNLSSFADGEKGALIKVSEKA